MDARPPCFRPRVMLVASAGGHWVQLLRLRPAWQGDRLTYVSTNKDYVQHLLEDEEDKNSQFTFYSATEANRQRPLHVVIQLLYIVFILVKTRPHVIITTGASIGYLAIRLGKLLGARTIWIDSIANVEELSLSGKLAGPYADLWLTQWEELAKPSGPRYCGAVF